MCSNAFIIKSRATQTFAYAAALSSIVDIMDAMLLAGAPIAPAIFDAGAPNMPAIEAMSSSRDGIFDTADTPAPYSPNLLKEWLPNSDDVVKAVKKVLYK